MKAACSEDSPASAGRPFLNRRGGMACSLALEPGDLLLVPTLGTAFVSVPDLLATLRVWQGCDVNLGVADLDIDSRTEQGREQLRQLAEVAALQHKGKAERARQRERERIAAGGTPGGRPPLGYRYTGRAGQRRLVADHEEQALLRRMARWRRTMTLREIWLHLLKYGATRRSTGREWSYATLAKAVPVGEKLLAVEAGAQR